MQDFGKWLTGKYLVWQVELGERKTLTEFAEYLGVSQSTVSAWMLGDHKPKSSQNVARLADKFGYEVYDLLGLPQPFVIRSQPSSAARALMNLPPVIQEAVEATAQQVEKQGDKLDEQAVARLLIESLEKRID
jgi:transcriptional regulator with XRE-family HTH domain